MHEPTTSASGASARDAERSRPRVSAVVLAWQAEPWLVDSVEALLASTDADVDVVLVDNGCTTDDVETLSTRDGVTVVRPGRNLGFAGGCNAGAAVATGDYIALVNGDAIVEPGTMAALVETLAEPDVAIATGSVRLSEDPARINAGGNPVHVLGLCWAGRLGEVEDRKEPLDVTSASGACLVTPRAHWERLGGFDDEYFAYHEDTELSLRTWRMGRRVVYRPDAVAVHRYEFSRNPFKMYLLERNRLLLLTTMWSTRSLVLLAPPLLAFELAMLAVAAKQGWLGAKLRGWGWMIRNAGHVVRRRRELRRELAVANRDWMDRLTATLDTTAMDLPAIGGPLNALMRAWWGVVRRLV